MSLKNIPIEYYGDDTRWFVGIVESVKDPLKMGRVRVRIFGIHSDNHSDIPQTALPWAQVVAPITQSGTSGRNGTPVGIKPSALVFGIFLDGKHSQLPLVLGSIPKIDGAAPPTSTSAEESQRSGGRGGSPTPGFQPNITGDVINNGGGRSLNSKSFSGGSTNEQAYNFLEEGFRLDLGLTNSRELAAGFVGNFMAESGYNLNYLAYNSQGGGEGANGIAQWRGDRYKNLIKFANAESAELFKNNGNKPIPSLKVQCAFVLHEIGGGDPYETSSFNKYIKVQKTARFVGDQVEAHYERNETPLRFKDFETRYKNSNIKKRVDYAAEVYAAFANRQPKTGPI